MRLSSVIDFLHSDAGASLVDTIQARTAAAATADIFHTRVSRTLDNYFLLDSERKAAIPNAVTHVIAKAADRDGNIDIDRVGALFGDGVKAMMLHIAELSGEQGTSRRHAKYRWMPDEVLEQVARSVRKDDIAERMPVLFELARAIASPTTFEGVSLFAVQHLFRTTRVLLDVLSACGADPSLALILGKNYSADHDTLFGMRADAWNAPQLALTKLTLTQDDGSEKEASPIAGYLASMFEGVDPTSNQRFMILDDGGKIIEALHSEPELRKYAHMCVAVEQTERGVAVIEEMQARGIELLCPVVNVAQAWLKKIYESAMIGESVAAAIEKSLAGVSASLRVTPKQATVIGYGAVGKATAEALRRRDYDVVVIEKDPAKHASIIADGFGVVGREEGLARAHLLVSCTGVETLRPDEYGLLPNHAVLANAASGNHELGMDRIVDRQGSVRDDPCAWVDDRGVGRSLFGGVEVRLGDIIGDEQTRHRVVRDDKGGERLVLRSGYVVNLFEDIPPEYIQLTRAMLFAALVQALTETSAEVVRLGDDVQRFIHRRTAAHLASLGKTLEVPSFA